MVSSPLVEPCYLTLIVGRVVIGLGRRRWRRVVATGVGRFSATGGSMLSEVGFIARRPALLAADIVER
jgi:hypothetical protein